MFEQLVSRALGRFTPHPYYAPPAATVVSGPWLIYVPRQETTSGGALAAGTILESERLNLLDSRFGSDGPTMMQHWELEHLQLPAALTATTAVAPETTLIGVLVLELLRAGDPVWAQPLEVPLAPTNVAGTSLAANFTFSEVFPRTVRVDRGRALELVCSVTFNQPLTAGGLILSGWRGGATSRQGILGYQSHTATGRRQL